MVKDSLRLKIRSTFQHFKVSVLIHDYTSNIFYEEYIVRASRLEVRIPKSDLPPGMLTITILDSTGIPVAERMIFVAPKRYNVEVSLDSSQYHTRSKVVLSIKTTNDSGIPVPAILSLAVVLKKRIDTTAFQDIVPFYYLFNHRQQIGLSPFPYGFGSNQQIESYLLTKGWTRYSWNTPDTGNSLSTNAFSTKFTGWVAYKKQKVRESLKINVLSGSAVFSTRSDRNGHFELQPEMLHTSPGADVYLMVDKATGEDGYSFMLGTEAQQLQSFLAQQKYPEVVSTAEVIVEGKDVFGKSVKALPEVIVKAKSISDFYSATMDYHSPNCDDYVCMFNILNCKNHPKAPQKPIEGKYYTYITPDNEQTKIKYNSCTNEMAKNFFSVKGRYLTKESYKADYATFNPEFPEVNSTIFWDPLIVIGLDGEAQVSFYTNDLTGTISCMLQGITNNGVLSGRKQFLVVE